MIYALYLINEAGICIFERHYVEKRLDADLVTGFMNAVGSFANEVFLSGLQSMELEDGKRLIYGLDKETKIMSAALTDQADHPLLLKRILEKVIKAFIDYYGAQLHKPFLPQINDEFKQITDNIIFRRIRKRGFTRLILGSITGFLLMCVTATLIIPLISSPEPNGEDPGPIILLLMVPSPFLAGLIAGNRKDGIIAGVLSIVPFYILISFQTSLPLFSQTAICVVVACIALTFGMTSGYIIERYYLNPIMQQPENQNAQKENKIPL